MLKKSFKKCFQGEAAAEKIIEIFSDLDTRCPSVGNILKAERNFYQIQKGIFYV